MIKGILFDIEGVLYAGDSLIQGAPETINKLREKGLALRFVSNITTKPRSELVKFLNSLGLHMKARELITPPVAAAGYIREKGYSNVAAFVEPELLPDLGLDQGNSAIPEKADCVVMGNLGEKMNFRVMDRIFSLVMDGAELLALQKDRYYKGKDCLVIDLGAFVAGMEYSTGKKARVMGKPSRDFFNLALKKLGISPENAVMVGDDLNSDIMGGNNAGLTTVLALSGKTSTVPEDVPDEKRPDFVIDSVAKIFDSELWRIGS